MEICPYKHTVQYYETDRMGITHHSNYIRWMEEARVDFLEQAGWGYDKLEEAGIISPVTSVQCQYKESTTFRDEVEIFVAVKEFKGVRLVLEYKMQKAGTQEMVCTAQSEHCFLDKEGHLVRLKKTVSGFHDMLCRMAEAYEN